MTATWRATQKQNRRAQLMRAAATLFAERGFAAVSTVELGESVGISGPALYNYVSSKDELLAEILLDASERLLLGCQEILDERLEDRPTLARLISFHIDFATSDPDTIRIQDRELAHLAPVANQRVRSLQRRYVQEWDRVLERLRPDLSPGERQTRLLAVFGLLNSTPHSAPPAGESASEVLMSMATRALTGDEPGVPGDGRGAAPEDRTSEPS